MKWQEIEDVLFDGTNEEVTKITCQECDRNIRLDEAIKLAQKKQPEYEIAVIIDIGDKWAFSYDAGDPPIPGIGIVTVSKADGEIGFLYLPSKKNFKLLDSGKVIYDSDVAISDRGDF